MTISHLSPIIVWKHFEEICKIPRISKHEEKIRKYLTEFANNNKLKVKEDSVGNILITRDADPGFENRKSILLQSHMDMVGEKNSATRHDWLNDPVIPRVEGEWVTAGTTTLGADDGIGIAAQMAILTDPGIKCGKIECLFTVDEETGMTGAINLEPGFFDSKILLNLDSEDEGELFIGCAGGIDTVAEFKLDTDKLSGKYRSFRISVTGLHGGHSGDEIHNGYANSVKLLVRVLMHLDNKYGVRISGIDAGNLRNAIPREAFAVIQLKDADFGQLSEDIREQENIYQNEYAATEKNIKLSIEETAPTDDVLTVSLQKRLLGALDECPHGVIAWSKTMNDLVETSTNLASVKIDNKIIRVVTSQRSSVDKAKIKLSTSIKEIFNKAEATVINSDGYPGWEPDTNSEILKITRESYLALFNREPVVRAIHAGLECGLILEKYPGLDMISFGPTIKGAHTPEERINIETTGKFWDLLLEVIKNAPLKTDQA